MSVLFIKINNFMCNNSFFSFMNEQKELLLQNGQFKTAVSYSCTLNSFFNFRRGKDLGIEEVTSELIQSYQSWLKQRGVVANTSSFYMRVLRAVYNKAVKKNLTVQQRPFEEVYTGIDKTQKRALTIEALRLLRNLDLSHKKKLAYARDLFMFSFYTRGIPRSRNIKVSHARLFSRLCDKDCGRGAFSNLLISPASRARLVLAFTPVYTWRKRRGFSSARPSSTALLYVLRKVRM